METSHRRGSRALRAGRSSNPRHVYLVTTVVQGRAPFFLNWEAACVASRTADTGVCDSRFLAWVLMPDHFHGLLLVGEGATLSETMRAVKGKVAREVNALLSRSGPLWQATFHDHAMRREEDLRAMARYVVANPMRAGLVARVGDYPFWNAEWL